jgi:hypothetical protein
MSTPARRVRARAWARPTIGSRIRAFAWRTLRTLFMLMAAMNPGLPPPPPPPAPTEQVDEDGDGEVEDR